MNSFQTQYLVIFDNNGTVVLKRKNRGFQNNAENQGFGEWRSLVAHIVRDDGVGGSNPLSPTIFSRKI